MQGPWRDRTGAISPLRIAALAAMALPGVLLAFDWATGELGPKPFEGATNRTGEIAVWTLFAALLVTPARQVLREARLVPLRRLVGLGALAYALAHLVIYAIDQGSLWRVASEILQRFYLALGFVALLLMTALGCTSTDGAVKRMGGAAWRRLHKLVFPAAVLAVTHAMLQAKTDVSAPMLQAGLLAWLLAYRVVAPEGGAPGRVAMLALALGAAAATAAGEALWYGLATGISGWLVLPANWDLELLTRPSTWVLGAGLALAALRTLPRRRAPRARAVPAPA